MELERTIQECNQQLADMDDEFYQVSKHRNSSEYNLRAATEELIDLEAKVGPRKRPEKLTKAANNTCSIN